MATSYITFFQTDIDPARNMIIEGIEHYLVDCPHTDRYEVMYIKPGMEANTVINWDQSIGWIPENNTYARVETDSKFYYYFVTKTEWKSPKAVGVSLRLDTVNTYWPSIQNHFTNRTHITRQHKDRFQTNWARIVDEYDEGITPVLRTKEKGALGGTDPLWYLIYKTELSNDNAQDVDNVVDCYCCTTQRIKKYDQVDAPIQHLYSGDFTEKIWYYLIGEDDCQTPGVKIDYSSDEYRIGTDGVRLIRFYVINSSSIMVYAMDNQGNIVDSTTTSTGIEFLQTRRVYYDTGSVGQPSGWTDQIEDIKQFPTRTLISGYSGTVYLEPISSVDRTDSMLIKIVELGYAPFNVTYTSGNIDTPAGWEYDIVTGLFKLNNLSTEFSNNSIAGFSLDGIVYTLPYTPDVDEVPNPLYESKLYNSNFYSLKFGYDTESWVFKPEKVGHETNLSYVIYPYITIEYKPSNGINSSCGFKFNYHQGTNTDVYSDDTDYPFTLISTRNNELPLYNNEYLNYLKYGKQYADRQTVMNITSTWLQTLLSIGGGMAAGAVAGGAPGAVVGGVVGAISGTANAITSTVKAIDSQQQKEWEMQHQTTNISGNSDLDIFKWYSQGKLWYFKREPTPRMKELLFQLFFRGGYTCNDYAVPNTNSRYWFNFLQCTPSFDLEEVSIYQPFLDDIRSRFEAGVTIFHEHDSEWTLNYEKENWERVLLRDLFTTTVTIEELQETYQYTINGHAYAPQAFDVIDLEWYWDEGSWDDKDPDDTTVATVGVTGNFQYVGTMQGGIAIRARIRNTITSHTSPWKVIWEAE